MGNSFFSPFSSLSKSNIDNYDVVDMEMEKPHESKFYILTPIEQALANKTWDRTTDSLEVVDMEIEEIVENQFKPEAKVDHPERTVETVTNFSRSSLFQRIQNDSPANLSKET